MFVLSRVFLARIFPDCRDGGREAFLGMFFGMVEPGCSTRFENRNFLIDCGDLKDTHLMSEFLVFNTEDYMVWTICLSLRVYS